MKKSRLRFSKQERGGIFFLLFLIVLLQCIFHIIKSRPVSPESQFLVDNVQQVRIDSLRKNLLVRDTVRLYPFNPNYINDYKGYVLGMTYEELDRIYDFRKLGNYVNSAAQFQEVTKVSDSLLGTMVAYFKFPKRKNYHKQATTYSKNSDSHSIKPKDINLATAEDLKSIYGVGEVLSARIIKFRNRLGGFVVNEQLYDVYGLEQEVVLRIVQKFIVEQPPKIEKLNINTASAQELASLVYIKKSLANQMVKYREEKGPYQSIEDLFNLNGFPINKIERIKLYLSL
ncbi:helix-hairpin-helix domain-containing protein [Muricauda sp. 2012CJ35-5]|uniref:Helix-hairpin-helix domain-containing protein n=1 Tax=Flagellimonas spongiicola TaxID=2942208 RepID=A0ABT0PV52_9FLAO|nr:helix-hairpin-helix domain-containing protein [Allomuricauda spongiicola]MCL6275267.1 helix-hairpin-helix domain-containing protein [Allomuricauda spongiicola]